MELTEKSFEEFFVSYYESLYGYAFSIVRDKMLAEEVVSDVFYKLWLKSDHIRIHTTLAAYMYSAVHHACMDQLKREKIKQRYQKYLMNEKSVNPGIPAELKDFQRHLREALAKLPEQCRTVFRLNREEGLSYKEIANRLGISVKTVETQMGRALKRLKISLSEFLTLLILYYVING